MSMIENIDFTAPWRQKAKVVALYLKKFLLRPVDTIRNIPEWDWSMNLGFVGAMAAASGFVGGATQKSVFHALVGAILFPISTTLFFAIIAGIIFYVAQFFLKLDLSYKRVFLASVLCGVPSLILHPFTFLVPPLILLSTFISASLLIVAIVANFSYPRRFAIKCVALAYGLFFVAWIGTSLIRSQRGDELSEMTSPESLDILEKELKGESQSE